jgi:hypothetical protein
VEIAGQSGLSGRVEYNVVGHNFPKRFI